MSFYTSLSGLRNAQTDLGVIAHNIANAETTGFKKSDTEFSDLVAGGRSADPRLTVGIGAQVSSIKQNFKLGATEQTGATTDLAINGDGFFAIRGAENNKTAFTRNGAFAVDGQGFMHDGFNNRLQLYAVDANGDVIDTTTTIDAQIPQANGAGAELSGISIGKNGVLTASYVDGSIEPVGRVALVSFIAPTGLRQLGNSQWESTGLSGDPTYGMPGIGRYGNVLSGALERSNVDLAEEMVGLITAQRNFQANAKAVDTATQLSQTILNLRS